MRIRKKAIGGVTFVLAALLAAGLTSTLAGADEGESAAGHSGEAASDSSGFSGTEAERIAQAKAIVEELNLERLEYPVDLENGPCTRAIDVDNVPYCLDSVATNDEEAGAIVARIRGNGAPSEEMTAWFDAVAEVLAAQDNLAKAEASGDEGAISAAHERIQLALDRAAEAGAAFEASRG